MSSVIRANFAAHNLLRPMVGDSKLSFTDFDHLGWLKCDGRLVNVADYMSLFKVVGYTFGGSGSQFKLPDMRGRVAGAAGAGAVVDDQGRTLSTRTKGEYKGEEVHQLTIAEMPIHNHDASASTEGAHAHTIGDIPQGTQNIAAAGGGSTTAAEEVRYTGTTSTEGSHTHTITVQNRGGDAVHNNMQPTLFVGNAFIYSGKLSDGAWPLQSGTDLI